MYMRYFTYLVPVAIDNPSNDVRFPLFQLGQLYIRISGQIDNRATVYRRTTI